MTGISVEALYIFVLATGRYGVLGTKHDCPALTGWNIG